MLAASAYNKDATYWPPSSISAMGDKVVGSPVATKVRWEDCNQMMIGPKGEQIISKARVFTLIDMAINGYLALGDYTDDPNATDPALLDTAFLVFSFVKVPSISGNEYERQALLQVRY